MSQRLQTVINEVVAGLDFTNDELEVLVETAFLAGATAMDALYKIEGVDPDSTLDDYVTGIAGLTQSVGGFLNSLTPDQVLAYKNNLKKVITHPAHEVELALESFADANLNLTAALLDVNKAIG